MTCHGCSGLYIVSMDHSPSEQLVSDSDLWHTTVIILSTAVQHSNLAKEIAENIRPRTGILSKWSKANKKYKKTFLKCFFDKFKNFPSIYVFAISAQEASIRFSTNHYLEEFGLKKHYQVYESAAGKKRVRLGPFIYKDSGESFQFEMSENRAVMCLHIAHFVQRMRLQMHLASSPDPNMRSNINWNFLADKFPGAPNEEMDLFFQVLKCVNSGVGQIIWGYFEESDSIETDLLADNLAGALKDSIQKLPNLLGEDANSGFFYWENWTQESPNI